MLFQLAGNLSAKRTQSLKVITQKLIIYINIYTKDKPIFENVEN